jgi:hypothetical protein
LFDQFLDAPSGRDRFGCELVVAAHPIRARLTTKFVPPFKLALLGSLFSRTSWQRTLCSPLLRVLCTLDALGRAQPRGHLRNLQGAADRRVRDAKFPR